ncbi:N5-glutamine methyltransferase family protein [Thiocapsa marina]|uniref:Modification methylase, HemK family n=1 Tax=Thiocapsa marina 5811 TaxID=768671 RepID=F9UAU3_9GAMM|nr:HemK/PrmC family methyltransferase [Thiocapsa marina]EGV18561.1 modification methylase, HemK family [Thiocapsa marina 5811]
MTQRQANPDFAVLLEKLREELRLLPDKPDETPETTLACLWALAAGYPLAVSQVSDFVPPVLDVSARTCLQGLIEERLSGVPLAHLTGRQDFMGRVLLASPAALVPRRETEQLGFTAVRHLGTLAEERPLVVDVCTGAGNVALGIAVHVPQARVHGADISEDAVALARSNARFLDREDVQFRCGDLFAPFAEPLFQKAVDLISCNPPYISSSRVEGMPQEISFHEPKLAFDGGPFGVGVIRRMVNEAPTLLKPCGWLLLEVGAGQGAGLARSLGADKRYDIVNTHEDAGGEIRVIAARLAPND